MKELDWLNHFPSLKVDRTEEGFFCQQKYAENLLKKFKMLECKPISTLIEVNAKLCTHEGKDLQDETIYQQFIRSLIYLTLI